MKFVGAVCMLLGALLGLGAWMTHSELKEMENRAARQSAFAQFINHITGSTAFGREFIGTGRRLEIYMWVACAVMVGLGSTLADWDNSAGSTTIITHTTKTTDAGADQKPASTSKPQAKVIDATLVSRPPPPVQPRVAQAANVPPPIRSPKKAKTRKLPIVLLAIVAGGIGYAARSPKPLLKNEPSLDGTWVATQLGMEGILAPPADEIITWTIHDDTVTQCKLDTMWQTKEENVGAYRVDASTSPKTMDFYDEEACRWHPAIYKLEGNQLTICIAMQPGAPRPQSFATAKGESSLLCVMQKR